MVAIVSHADDKLRCLIEAIESAGLRASLEESRSTFGVSGAEFSIFIKPDLTFFFRPALTYTDPALVEGLIDWLHDAGYERVSIGTSSDGTATWLDNRDPLILADQAGYRFETPKGRGYDVIDLGEDLVDASFPESSVLKGSQLAKPWLDACYRISFGKCKTDEAFFYAGALQNLLAVLPLADKQLHYEHRLRAEDAVADLLRLTKVHFGIVDAFVANQGNAGVRHADPVCTSTIIASAIPQLADWATALKMGLDPYVSPVVAKVLRETGWPERPKILGDLTPFPGFRNVQPMLAAAVNQRNASLEMQRSATAWMQTVDRQLFPFKDQVTDKLNLFLAYQFGSLDTNPLNYATYLALNYSLAGVNQSIEGVQTLAAKSQLHWIERPLNLDVASYTAADYEKSRTYMEPLEEIVVQLPPDKDGLRWRYLDSSVLFHCSRRLPIPFDEFVKRVDIAQSVRMMNDYIGGACVPVIRDAAGRVSHQAERNLYLPQPNYIVFTGGQPIDVSKLEYITYSEVEHKIFWRTILSENQTGKFDDGTVSFARTEDDGTLVTIVARQEFILPPFWQLLNLDLSPVVKDYLVSDAYRKFFVNTIANFEAAFEGRDFRVGRPWPTTAPSALPSERLAQSVQELAGTAREAIDKLTSRLSFTAPKPAPVLVDEQGFAHFGPSEEKEAEPPLLDTTKLQNLAATAITFTKELAQAFAQDLAAASQNRPEEPKSAGTSHGR
jgi:uncharacterized protein (DUF362 family)